MSLNGSIILMLIENYPLPRSIFIMLFHRRLRSASYVLRMLWYSPSSSFLFVESQHELNWFFPSSLSFQKAAATSFESLERENSLHLSADLMFTSGAKEMRKDSYKDEAKRCCAQTRHRMRWEIFHRRVFPWHSPRHLQPSPLHSCINVIVIRNDIYIDSQSSFNVRVAKR